VKGQGSSEKHHVPARQVQGHFEENVDLWQGHCSAVDPQDGQLRLRVPEETGGRYDQYKKSMLEPPTNKLFDDLLNTNFVTKK
jgi:hypothetical protein